MTPEIWKDIPGYEGMYQISNLGNVRSLLRKAANKSGMRTIPQKNIVIKNSKGYKHVKLYKNNKCQGKSVHRLIAHAFIPNPNNLPHINHIDGNPQNNSIDNLEWCDHKHNMKHAQETGLMDVHKRKILAISPDGFAYKFDSMKEGAIKLSEITGIKFNKICISSSVRSGRPYLKYKFYYGHEAPEGLSFKEEVVDNNDQFSSASFRIVLRIVKTETKEEQRKLLKQVMDTDQGVWHV